MSWTINVSFPYPFSALISSLSIFSFEFLSFECTFEHSDFFTAVYMWSVTPLLLTAAIFLGLIARLVWSSCGKKKARDDDAAASKETTHRIVTEHIFLGLLLTYLVVPPVLQVLFQSLDCFELSHSGDRYLRIDTAINCDDAEYIAARRYVIFFIIIYLSIPAIWMRFLWSKRALLNPRNLTKDEALHQRDNDQKLTALRFLFSPYRLSAFLFEPAEMYRFVRIHKAPSAPLAQSVSP